MGLGGCQEAPLAQGNTWLPYPDAPDRARSIVFHSPAVSRVLTYNDSNAPAAQPWYASRNDAVRAVAAGYQSPTVDRAVTITHDRQVISGGRSRDHYSSTTYRQSVTTTVR